MLTSSVTQMIYIFVLLVTGLDQEPEFVLNDNCVRFRCLELTQEGQWHHLVLIFNRAGIMKNSSVSLYVDAELVSTQKVSEETIERWNHIVGQCVIFTHRLITYICTC